MLIRIIYYIKNHLFLTLLKTFIFCVFMCFFLVSFLFGSLSSLFEESFSSLVDHTISVYTKYSFDNHYLTTLDDTRKFENDMAALFHSFNKEPGITYSDYWISTGESYPLTTTDITDDNQVLIYNDSSYGNTYYVEADYLLKHGVTEYSTRAKPSFQENGGQAFFYLIPQFQTFKASRNSCSL